MYWGAPAGGAVFAFWTLTSRSRQRLGRTTVWRSTPSMLKPCCSSKGDHSPATPSIRSPSDGRYPRWHRGRSEGCRPRQTSWLRLGSSSLPEGAKNGLRADHDHGMVLNDLAGGPDGVFELVAPHQAANPGPWTPLVLGSSPPMGETSRICTESGSSPVRTRRRPGVVHRVRSGPATGRGCARWGCYLTLTHATVASSRSIVGRHS